MTSRTEPEPAAGRPGTPGRALPAPGNYMCGLTWDGTWLWHSDQGEGAIYAIDPGDGSVARSFECEAVRADLAYDGTYLCQIGGRPKRLVLIDPASGEPAGERPVLPATGQLTGVEYGPEGAWMLLRGPTVVQLRSRDDLGVVRQFPARGESPAGLTYADGVVVYGDFEQGTLTALRAADGTELGSIGVPGRPTGLTWDGERIWYCDFPARAIRSLALPDGWVA